MPSTTSNTKSVTRAGKKLRKLRKVRGISQADFADRIGVSRGYISNVENGYAKAGEYVKDMIQFYFNDPYLF